MRLIFNFGFSALKYDTMFQAKNAMRSEVQIIIFVIFFFKTHDSIQLSQNLQDIVLEF